MNMDSVKNKEIASSIARVKHHIQSGDLGTAESICQDILKKNPNQIDALYLLATLAFRQNKLQAAINIINTAISAHPASANFYLLLGDVFTKLGRLNDAEKNYHTSIKLNPESAETHNNLGIIYKEQGKFDNAKNSFEKAISINPKRCEFLNNRAVIALNENSLDEAENLLEKAVNINSNYTDAYSNLGKVLANKGELDKAKKYFEKTIQLNPNYKTAYFDLGRLYSQMNNLEIAKDNYQKALNIDKDYCDALINLGIVYIGLNEPDSSLHVLHRANTIKQNDSNILRHMGLASANLNKLNDALKYYNKALLFEEDYQIYINIGAIYFKQELYRKAIKIYEKAIYLNPESYHAYSNIGIALVYAGLRDPEILEDNYEYLNKDKNLSKAEIMLKKAIELNPNFSDAYSNLWAVYRQLGQKDKSIECCTKSVELNPDHAIALFNLTLSTKHSKENTGQKDKLEALLETNLSDEDKCHCHFALARINNEINNFDEAFEHAQIANKIKSSQVNFDFKHYGIYIDNIINIFTDNFIENKRSYGNQSETPVFIVGMPRSGTSLVEQIIDTHPLAGAVGEVSYIHILEGMLPQYMNSDKPFMDLFPSINEETISVLSKRYLKLISDEYSSALRITDKMPNNFLSIGFIKILFPNAHIINCIRNPADILTSIYFILFTSTNEYAYDLDTIMLYHKEYERIMEHWNSLKSVNIYNVVYEDLIQNQEEISKEIINHIGLEWDPACLSFYDNTRPARTASTDQVTQPIYTSSINRWKKYEKYLKPYFDKSNFFNSG